MSDAFWLKNFEVPHDVKETTLMRHMSAKTVFFILLKFMLNYVLCFKERGKNRKNKTVIEKILFLYCFKAKENNSKRLSLDYGSIGL